MNKQKLRVRQDLERMVVNYRIRGDITEDQCGSICRHIDSIIGGGEWRRPVKCPGAVIQFPGSYAGAERSKPEIEKPLEIYSPYGEPMPEGFRDFREALQRDGLILISYDARSSREGTLYNALWARSNNNSNRCRYTEWSGLAREEEVPYVLPLDGIRNDYNYRDILSGMKMKYIVNVAPANVLEGPIQDFFDYVESLKAAGMKNDFEYIYNFGAEKRNRFLARNKELIDIQLPTRMLTKLDDRGVHTLKDLQALSAKDLEKLPNIGPSVIKDTLAALKKAGLTLRDGDIACNAI